MLMASTVAIAVAGVEMRLRRTLHMALLAREAAADGKAGPGSTGGTKVSG
jgi:hypothetical protein